MSFEFLDKPGDDTTETLSSESPSDKRLVVVLLCFSHMAYVLNSGFTSAYVWVSDKLPSFILAEFLFAILSWWILWGEMRKAMKNDHKPLLEDVHVKRALRQTVRSRAKTFLDGLTKLCRSGTRQRKASVLRALLLQF
jgi:hypothetical protein